MHPNPKRALKDLHKYPGLYWGGGDCPFTSWIAFTAGFSFGHEMAGRDGGFIPEDLVPDGFNKFVTERFGETYPAGGRGWITFIRENTSSEREAFDLFFQIREEYDRVHETQDNSREGVAEELGPVPESDKAPAGD